MRVFLSFLLSFAVVAAVPANQQRIVGGSAAAIIDYPGVASLLNSYGATGYRHACTGNILTPRSILTVATCTANSLPSRWQSRVGSASANTGGALYPTESILNHPNFNWRTLENDISIIRTVATITFTPVIAAVNIAGTAYNVLDGQVLYAVGWGATTFGGSSSELLQYIQIWSINQAVCRNRYTEVNRNVYDSMLCSGWLDVGGRGQCTGDSGSPLYHNGILVGLYSFSERCGVARYPAVTTRISSFTPWIQANA